MGATYIRSLHGLRGLAAVTVLIGHYRIVRGEPGLGVVLFFVLSGFLIGRLYLEKPFNFRGVTSYLLARFARVYPLFAVVVIAAGLINCTIPTAEIFELLPAEVPEHLLLAGSAKTIWTICTEFQFYFLFVLLWWGRGSVKSPLWLVIPALLLFGLWSVHLRGTAGRTDITTYLHVFLIGIAISSLTRDGSDSWRRSAKFIMPFVLVGYALVYLVAPSLHGSRTIYIDPAALLSCGLLVFCSVKAGDSWVNKVLSTPLMYWLGEISFGIYLFHRLSTWAIESAVGGAPPWLSISLQVALTLVLAQLAYWVIELPCRSRIRATGEQWLDRRVAMPT